MQEGNDGLQLHLRDMLPRVSHDTIQTDVVVCGEACVTDHEPVRWFLYSSVIIRGKEAQAD